MKIRFPTAALLIAITLLIRQTIFAQSSDNLMVDISHWRISSQDLNATILWQKAVSEREEGFISSGGLTVSDSEIVYLVDYSASDLAPVQWTLNLSKPHVAHIAQD